MFGAKNIIPAKIIKKIIKAYKSLTTMYGLKGTVSLDGFFISKVFNVLYDLVYCFRSQPTPYQSHSSKNGEVFNCKLFFVVSIDMDQST